MNMKKTIVCLLAMAVVVLCQSLTACKDNEPEHVHDWGAFGAPTPATATADSIATRTCATCGATDTQPVAGYRETYINLFDNGQAKVEGTLLLAEWNNVITQLPSIVNERYAAGTSAVQMRYAEVISRQNFIITVEKTNEYVNWKTDASGISLRLNYNALSNWSSIMNDAVRAMNDYKATQDAQYQNGQWVE